MKIVLQSKKFESKDNAFVVSTDQENLLRFGCLKSSYDSADIWLSYSIFETFLIYQRLVARKFRKMQKRYGLLCIYGNRSIEEIGTDFAKKLTTF